MKRVRARVPAARVSAPVAAEMTAEATPPTSSPLVAPASASASPAKVRALLHGAIQVHQAGDLARAEQAYRRVLQLQPEEPDALHLLGLLAHQVGRNDIAVNLITRAIGARPKVAIFHNHLGNALQALGRAQEAVKSYGRALVLDPGHQMVHNNLGNALQVLGRYDEAVASYRRALTIRDDFADAHSNLAAVLQAQGKLDEALVAAERAVALLPDSAAAHNNHAVILQAIGRPEEAVVAFRRAIELDPAYATARTNLANTLHALDRLDEAEACAREAVELAPAEANGHNTLGNVLRELGRLDESADAYRAGLEIQPGNIDIHSNLIFVLDLTAGAAEAAWTERRHWNERHAAPRAELILPHRNAPDPERRLRVGYVSGDFRRHSAAYAILPIIEAHDPAQVEVTCYSVTLRPDDLTERFRAAAHRWREVALLDEAALAEQIRADEIDILVDLSGHSAGHRLLTFARRPAPVQVSAWGYAAGTGLDAMDYVFADAVTVPADARRHYREEVVELPAVLCYQPPAISPEVAPLPAPDRGYVTFGSFNRPAKLTGETLALWARVLRAVPNSRLLLKFGGLERGTARDRILGALAAAGVEPERVEIRGGTPQQDHLAAYGDVDLALDPVPQGGGITTLEGIWMGVPPVTLLGERIPGRVAGSLLHALGLPELVASTPDEYVAVAVRAAADLTGLAARRAELRDRLVTSPVGNPPLYVRAVEDAYRAIWRRWCAEPRDQA